MALVDEDSAAVASLGSPRGRVRRECRAWLLMIPWLVIQFGKPSHSPALDAALVSAAHDSEEAVFAEVGVP